MLNITRRKGGVVLLFPPFCAHADDVGVLVVMKLERRRVILGATDSAGALQPHILRRAVPVEVAPGILVHLLGFRDDGASVKLGIDAPRSVVIMRPELWAKMSKEQRAATLQKAAASFEEALCQRVE